MEKSFLACPNCGSTWLKVKTGADEIIFRLNSLYIPLIPDGDAPAAEGLLLSGMIRCGACSWSGSHHDLLPSRDE
ncbi:MAG TPA: hypothetical protein ENK84_07285 [Desulfobulbus sp.]|nr:hypothetical protein [Desulfobulbus sp.]HHD63591.1 hypothetical protein [Desulfobulbaceae bacterium]